MPAVGRAHGGTCASVSGRGEGSQALGAEALPRGLPQRNADLEDCVKAGAT